MAMTSRCHRSASPLLAVVGLLVGGLAGAVAPRWEPAWGDDFKQLDESKWTRVDTPVTTNQSLQDYLPEQVSVAEGRLVITADDRPSRDRTYRSGQVISRSEQRFGRWEIRAKLPASRGMWPAIWLLPEVAKHQWPSGGEIDIVENRGDEPLVSSSAFHYGTNPPYQHDFVLGEQSTSLDGQRASYHDSFHTYAVDWTPRYLRFYVDGVNHYTVYDEDLGGFLSKNAQPMQLVINNAIGGKFLDDPDGSTVLPQRMEIDWVKVYELSDKPGKAAFANGDFEAEGGTLVGWSLFGARTREVQNALVASEAVLEGEASLKLYGPGDGGERFSGLSQGITVAPGAEVTASLSAFVRSQDSLAGGDNRVLMKIEFYNAFGAKYGPPAMLGEHETLVANGQTPNDEWLEHNLTVTAPAGTVEARLVLLFDQPSGGPGAVHLDEVRFGPPASLSWRGQQRQRPL